MREGRDGMTVLLFLFVLVCVVMSGCSLGPPLVISKVVTERVVERQMPASAPSLPDTLATAWRATVFVRVNVGKTDESCGSGVLVAPNRVLTAGHVINHGERAAIKLIFTDGATFAGRVYKVNLPNELAMIGFEGHVSIEPVSLASESPAFLSSVWNIGAPECHPGYVSDGRWGILDRTDHKRIFTGGMMWPGMSGGPVVDAQGDVVGINQAVWADDEHTIIPGMGRVVDWKTIKEFMQ